MVRGFKSGKKEGAKKEDGEEEKEPVIPSKKVQAGNQKRVLEAMVSRDETVLKIIDRQIDALKAKREIVAKRIAAIKKAM